MKLFVLLSALAVVANAGNDMDMFNDYAKMKKWMKMKAMEGCYGSENMETYMVKSKKAMQKCMGDETPSFMDLPMYKSPHRVVHALLMGAKSQQSESLMMLKKMMMAKMEKESSPQQVAYVPYPMMQQQQSSEEDMMMKMIKKMMMKKMFKKMMMHAHGDMMEADEEDEDEETESPSALLRNLDTEEFGLSEIIKAIMETNVDINRAKRNKRATDGDLYDLGEKLSEKLEAIAEKHKAKMGNASCVLQELNMIDSDNNLDLPSMMKDMDSYTFKDEWFGQQNKKICRMCYAVAENMPREVLKEMPNEKWFKIKFFHNCMMKKKVKICMAYDIKQKLEKHFGSIEDLEEETGLDEKELLPLTYQLLHGGM